MAKRAQILATSAEWGKVCTLLMQVKQEVPPLLLLSAVLLCVFRGMRELMFPPFEIGLDRIGYCGNAGDADAARSGTKVRETIEHGNPHAGGRASLRQLAN